MTWDTIQGVLRAILAAVGGILVTKGYLDGNTLNDAIGGLLAVGTAIWSIIHNNAQAAAAK